MKVGPAKLNYEIEFASRKDSKFYYYFSNKILTLILGVYSADLWQFTLPGNQWMWISGPQATNVEGVYTDFGTVSSDLAYPGARASAMCWTDLTNNVFGFFGGIGFGERNSNSGTYVLNM